MEEADFAHAEQLSLRSARPPIVVPGYEQEQFLGRGAFGEVWKAVDSNSGRLVAIKYYNHRGGLDWSHMTREVEKLQYLFSDRHVVQLFDVGWDSDPPYYVMEYMAYGSLEDRLRSGPMTVPEAVKTIREIAVGLAHAHDKGILHCDLKPGNIMLDQDGRPRLADFGQARLKHEQAPALGTLFYMAPEQADLSAVPDARWDVYALGAMLYRMITGELPYLNDEISHQISSQHSLAERLECYSHLASDQKKPKAHRLHPGVDKELANLIDGCLEVSPTRRYPNVQSVLQALQLREHRKSQRPMLLVGLLGPVLVVLLMAFVAWFLIQKTIDTASANLLERTGESNHFAAQSVAERFGLEVDKRWRILEQESEQQRLRDWLASDEDSAQQELQTWLEQRHTYWNAQFTSNTVASYWFVLDRNGKVRAISPRAESLVGSYFGYREYFHGQGRELSPYDPVPDMISTPHRSNVFRSQPSNQPAVAFSVPIRSEAGPTAGILAMETELGHFAEFQGSRDQLSVLVDLRPDQNGQPGLIVEHPALDQLPSSSLQPSYLSKEQLAACRALCGTPSEANDSSQVENGTLKDYRDPIDRSGAIRYLASVAPVLVPRGKDQTFDTGWAILVQEPIEQTLSPLHRLSRLFLYGGLAALGLAALIIGGLWWIVFLVANAPGRLRSLRFWTLTPTLHSQTSTTASMRQSP
jgi:serine/threonine protein kinase